MYKNGKRGTTLEQSIENKTCRPRLRIFFLKHQFYTHEILSLSPDAATNSKKNTNEKKQKAKWAAIDVDYYNPSKHSL